MANNKEPERFVKVWSDVGFSEDKYIYVDRVTGVNYLFISHGYAGGLYPLLGADGKPVVTPLYNNTRKD